MGTVTLNQLDDIMDNDDFKRHMNAQLEGTAPWRSRQKAAGRRTDAMKRAGRPFEKNKNLSDD